MLATATEWLKHALCYARDGYNAQAGDCASRVLADPGATDDERAEAHVQRARALFRSGLREEARAGLAALDGPLAEHSRVLGTLAFLRDVAGDHEAARTLAERALAADPGEPMALRVVSRARTRAGDAEGALADLERGYAHPTDGGFVLAEAGRVLADALGRPADAARMWMRAAERGDVTVGARLHGVPDPTPKAAIRVALYQAGQRDRTAAIATLQAVLARTDIDAAGRAEVGAELSHQLFQAERDDWAYVPIVR